MTGVYFESPELESCILHPPSFPPAPRMKFSPILLLALLGASALGEDPLLIQATPSLVPFARDIVRPLHDAGIETKMVDTAGNSQIAAALGSGKSMPRCSRVRSRWRNARRFPSTTLR